MVPLNFAYDPNGAGRVRYEYWTEDKYGNTERVVLLRELDIVVNEVFKSKYFVYIDEFEFVEISEAQWEEITIDLFKARDNALPSMTFEEVFGNMQ